MPKNKDFALRIEIIDECLRRRQKRWSLNDLLTELNRQLSERYGKEVSLRTLQYDLKFLIEEKQAPVEVVRENKVAYYKYKEANYSVMNLPVSEEEISILKDAVKMLRQVNDFKIIEDVDTIIDKLEHTVSTNISDSRSMIQFEKHTSANGAEHIDDLFSAIREKVVLKISYQPFSAEEPREWTVHPYLLKEFRNRWFLICRVGSSDQVTNLALDRIIKIKNSSVAYCENDLFDPETYYDYVIGVTIPHGSIIQDIVLKVSGKQVNYVKTKPIHKSQTIDKELQDGSLIIGLRLVNNYELQSVLLGYMPDIEIISPLELRQQLHEKLVTAANANMRK